jgi:hypothetical protein
LTKKYIESRYKEFLVTKVSAPNKRHSISLIKKSVKNVQDFFHSTSFKKKEWPYTQSELDILVAKKLLYFFEQEGCYFITYKGLVALEYDLEESYSIDCYLNDVNPIFFDNNMKMKDEPLKVKDKVILLTTIGLCAFSSTCSFSVDETNKHDFSEAANLAIDILKEYDKKNISELNKMWESKIIGEDPILSTLRRLDEIPKKTGNVFKTPSGNKHGIYVDVLNKDETLDDNKIIFLLRKVFGRELVDLNRKQSIINTLNEIEKKSFTLINSDCTIDKIKIKMTLRDTIIEKL